MIYTPGQAKVLHATGKLRVRQVCKVNGQTYYYGDPVPRGLDEHQLANLLSLGYLETDDRPLLQKPRQPVSPAPKDHPSATVAKPPLPPLPQAGKPVVPPFPVKR